MRLFKYFCLLILIALTYSCKKEIPFPDDAADSFLVVNSLFSPNNPLQVYVGKSFSINDTNLDDNYINNAQVLLKDDQGNILSELEHNGNGLYSGNMSTISHATTYQIEVNQPGQTTKLTSKSHVPKEFTCNYIGHEEQYINERLVWGFELEIVDNPDEVNFYMIEGYFDIENGEHDDGTEEVNGYIQPHTGHYTNDPNAENSSILSGTDFEVYPLRSVFLTDKNFNGETYRTTLGLRDWDILNQESDAEEFTANVFVKSVSKEMYEYHKSLELYRLSQNNIFAQPEVIYSNIENGLGIFGGYTQQVFVEELPRSEYVLPSDIIIENGGCTTPCIVSFSTDGGSKLNYSWDFGDGNSSTEANPEHSYSSPGEYQVQLDLSTTPGDIHGWGMTVIVN